MPGDQAPARHEVAQGAVADQGDAGVFECDPQVGVVHEQPVVVDAGLPVGGHGFELGAVHGGVQVGLGHPRPEPGDGVEEDLAAADTGHVHEVVGEHYALLGGQGPEGEPDERLAAGPRQPQGELELHGQVEVRVEEFRLDLHGAHVGVEVAHVEAPQDGALDLGAALAAYLVEIGVVPDVLHGAGESSVAVEKRRGMGDGTPSVQVEFGVDREVHAHVVAAVGGRGTPGPRARDHQAGTRGQAVAEGLVDPHVGGVTEAEVVAVQYEQLGVVGVAESFGERWHAPDGSALAARTGSIQPRVGSGGVGPGGVRLRRRRPGCRRALPPEPGRRGPRPGPGDRPGGWARRYASRTRPQDPPGGGRCPQPEGAAVGSPRDAAWRRGVTVEPRGPASPTPRAGTRRAGTGVEARPSNRTRRPGGRRRPQGG